MEKWLEDKPQSIREAYAKRPPDKLYRMSTGHIVFIMSYIEPNAGPLQCDMCKAGALEGHGHKTWDVPTVSVGIITRYNPDLLFERRVFGVTLDELVEVPAGTVAEGKA